MTEGMQQALKKETERYIAEDILYDDVYVGQFNEKDGAECALHAVEWYRNNVWHNSEEPNKPLPILAIKPDGKSAYTGTGFTVPEGWLWAYLEDLLPAQQSSPSS